MSCVGVAPTSSRWLIAQAPAKSAASANGTGTGKRPITIGQSDIISCANRFCG
jgi:hypothetical protein